MKRWIFYALCALVVGTLFYCGLIFLAGFPAKRVAVWTFVVIWFVHVFMGAGAAYAAWRLWPNRDNIFVRRVILLLHALMISGIWSVVAIFMAQGVKFTWTFSLTFFGSFLIIDCVKLPLILYIIRGPGTAEHIKPVEGAFSPEFWLDQFNDLKKRIDSLAQRKESDL